MTVSCCITGFRRRVAVISCRFSCETVLSRCATTSEPAPLYWRKWHMTVSSQRLHILKALKRQGLSLEMLHNVFYAIIVSRFTAFLLGTVFLVKSQVIQINSFFKRAYKYGYLKSIITIEELLDSYDDHLFHRASRDNHCLHHLLPVARLPTMHYEMLVMACQ